MEAIKSMWDLFARNRRTIHEKPEQLPFSELKTKVITFNVKLTSCAINSRET